MATSPQFAPFLLAGTRHDNCGPHVFGMAIPPAFLGTGAAPEWLSAEEKAALAAMGSPRRRAQFAAGRWLLHHAGTFVLGKSAHYRVQLTAGRPFLAIEGAGGRMAASLSHSGDRVLCALAPAGLVGVDVERIRARKRWHELASFALHPAEREHLDALEGEARWRGFYRAWTLKEAMAKALGVGLALPFDRIAFSDDNRIDSAPGGQDFDRAAWHFYTLELGAGYAAAAAWRDGEA
jgi:4'-phosphopantetheinyl transferase